MRQSSYLCNMSKTAKTIFLGLCVIGSFLIYCVYYYSNMLRNAPFRFSDFEYIDIRYGEPDAMLNSYNSATGEYRFLNKQDQVVEKTLKLTDDDLLYIHRKAMEMGFWNVDDDMTTSRRDSTAGGRVPRFVLELKYSGKGKRVAIDADFPGNPKMRDAAMTTVETVIQTINRAAAR